MGLRSGVSESPMGSRRCRKCARRSSRTSVHWTSAPPSAKDSRWPTVAMTSSAGGSAAQRLGRPKLALPLARLLPLAFAYDATALERAKPGLQQISAAVGGKRRFQLYARLPLTATIGLLAPGE